MKTFSGISCWLAAVAVLLTGSLVQGQVPIIRPGQSADLSINQAPQPILRSRRLKNMPETGLFGYKPTAMLGVYNPDQFWMEGGDAANG